MKWLNDAKFDLKEIYEYISHDSKIYARLQIEKIKKASQKLKTFPEIGKNVEEISNQNI
ncbi:type II toxin-antitoxin system RelE/ParE family toxin [Aequorivita echinoideorum]|uniref:Type II toxin-antitoxin system RelE/ParE family toxin n=1 Tax=Aequorivita echinoideorum TaxID=1549647 RepID=A0ABS5S5K3_9FLAO|nr:type II toxin-antitoxin system RelE/ParE family toxin [Aequorivita echinoideorum]